MFANATVYRRWALVIALLAVAGYVWAAEHPAEHPTEGGPVAESAQEHPATAPAEAHEEVSKENLAKAIEHYVKRDAVLKGGYFLVFDAVAKEPLVLTLVKVHKERLANLGGSTYFACADFETREGKIYDLDIFMKGPNAHHLKVTRILVHKEAGQPGIPGTKRTACGRRIRLREKATPSTRQSILRKAQRNIRRSIPSKGAHPPEMTRR